MRLLQGITERTKAVLDALMRGAGAAAEVGRGFASEIACAMSGLIKFSSSNERSSVHRDMHRMDREDEIAQFAFNTIASRAMGYPDPTVNSFTVVVESTKPGNKRQVKDAQAIVDDLIDRLQLRPKAWQIVRRGVKYGNDFQEVLFERDEQGTALRISGLKTLPEHTVWPNTNERGDRLPGFTQKADFLGGKEIRFEPYEIVHFLFGEEDGYLGTPLLKCARHNWKRLNLAEDSTATARLIRAFAKWLHKVPVNSDWSKQEKQDAIERYKQQMLKRPVFNPDVTSVEFENNPMDVSSDFFIPDDGSKRGGVEMFDPENAQLQNIRDIEHFLRRFINATTVPFRYFPFEGSTPKLSEGGGNAEDVNFACTLLMCHQMLQQGYNQLISTELVLHGIDVTNLRFIYRMAPLNTTDLLRAAQTDAAKARTLDLLSKQLPGIVDHPDVILREFTSLSDASVEKLLGDENLSKPRAGSEDGNKSDPRVQLPGTGTGAEARTKA